MLVEQGLYIGKGTRKNILLPSMANRHGLITGATGTGKTVTLKVMAESFSDLGVPVFMADVKGDLSGMMKAGSMNDKIEKRLQDLDIDSFTFQAYPTVFWDIFAKHGIPVRTTISEMGALLLGQILELNPTQQSVLEILFRIADDQQLILLDYKDLKALVAYVIEHAKELKSDYGNLPSASIATIQRRLISLESNGFAEVFFGEEALSVSDFICTDKEGRGVINLLRADVLYQQPKLYATFLLWLLSELFEALPEEGDREQPKLIFFFDEAHLLFQHAPKALLEKVEQVVRLIRSKGVGVYFITQSPEDIPDVVLGQLGNRVQHALRAYTPREQKAIRAAAASFRADKSIHVEEAIMNLKVGEALLSFLDEEGRPSVVDVATILPPMSQIGQVEEEEVTQAFKNHPYFCRYSEKVDRESAFELLRQKVEREHRVEVEKDTARHTIGEDKNDLLDTILKTAGRAASSAIGRQIGTQLVRGILGSLLKKR